MPEARAIAADGPREVSTISPLSSPSRSLNSLRWRLNRLRCMTPRELPHRVLRALSSRVGALGLLGDGRPTQAADLTRQGTTWLHADARIDAAPVLAAAERIARDRFDIFALRDVSLGMPPRWNRDPKTGIEVPLVFGQSIDYRDPARVGDIKYLWEPNRHAHFVTLAQAWHLSGDQRWLSVFRLHLESWLDACPYGQGPNWISALEASLRLVAWSAAWQLLGGSASRLFDGPGGTSLRERWLVSVHQHASFVRDHFSLHSSANNHLVGEVTGLWIAALTWPLWPAADRWLDDSRALLESEALLQNAPDGVNREQAVGYHLFELDLLVIAAVAARAAGRPFSSVFEARIESMLDVVASIMDAGGGLPMFGDDDQSKPLDLVPARDFPLARSLLATGALLFDRADFAAKAGALDDRSRWLFGPEADAAFARLDTESASLPVRRAFPDGGLYILGGDFETPDEVRLVVDAGPHGYPRPAAHAHADALSFTLSLGGRPMLVDPGTYAYHADARWRDYFRGTSAHNTLRIDGEDQSEPGGNFMWLSHAHAGCDRFESNADGDVFDGWHDGYCRLRDPVLHRRRIRLEPRERCITIEDRLEMRGGHDVELFFHCHPACRVELRPDGRCEIRDSERALSLEAPDTAGGRIELHRGSLDPIAGWFSPGYDDKQPSFTIAWRARLRGHALLKSRLVY